jgi:hypothetical protein
LDALLFFTLIAGHEQAHDGKRKVENQRMNYHVNISHDPSIGYTENKQNWHVNQPRGFTQSSKSSPHRESLAKTCENVREFLHKIIRKNGCES